MNRKKVAIAIFGDQVSQRFDCAREIIVIETADGDVCSRQTIPVDCLNGIQIMRAIVASGAEMVVCGAMPCFYYRMAEASGIEVAEASGPVGIVLEQLLEGKSPGSGSTCRRGRRHGHERGSKMT